MRAGVVGCGRVAPFHIRPLLGRLGASAVAVTDSDPAAARSSAAEHGLSRTYASLEAMLVDHDPDVIHVLTPPATHARLAVRALEAGSHVLVEKPMATSLREAEAMVDAAERHGRQLCVDHNYVWHPLARKTLALVEEGTVGTLLHVDVRYPFDIGRLGGDAAGSTPSAGGWLDELRGGVLFDLLPHPASILLALVGETGSVEAVGRGRSTLQNGAAGELVVLVEGTRASGSLAISLGSRPDSLAVTVYGTAATVHLNWSNMTLVIRKPSGLPKPVFRVLDNLSQAGQILRDTLISCAGVALGKIPVPGDPAPLIERFYDGIERGLPSPAPGEAGRDVVRLAERIWGDEDGGPEPAPDRSGRERRAVGRDSYPSP